MNLLKAGGTAFLQPRVRLPHTEACTLHGVAIRLG